MTDPQLIACHECDTLHRQTRLPPGAKARCVCCGSVLYRNKKNSLERTLTLTITGLILLVLANTFPLLSFEAQALAHRTTLMGAVHSLYVEGKQPLALLVVATTVVAPVMQLTGLLYVTLPLWFNRTPRYLVPVFLLVGRVAPWAMIEVFMLGILVSVVKLAKMATIVPGVALYAFASLIFVLAATSAFLDPRLVWDRARTP